MMRKRNLKRRNATGSIGLRVAMLCTILLVCVISGFTNVKSTNKSLSNIDTTKVVLIDKFKYNFDTVFIKVEPKIPKNPDTIPLKQQEYYKCIAEIDSYIKKNYPGSKLHGKNILDECIKYKISPVFVLSQGIIESSLGTAGAARRTNNVWNVGHCDGMSTAAVMKTKNAYSNPNHSIETYLKYVKTKYLGNSKTIHDLMRNYVTLSGHRYASNPRYEYELKGMYNYINKNTKINNYFNRLI